MLRKKMYSRSMGKERGYTLIVEYSLFGMIFYKKENSLIVIY